MVLVLDMRGFNHVRLDRTQNSQRADRCNLEAIAVVSRSVWAVSQGDAVDQHFHRRRHAQCECARDRARSWASGADGSFVSASWLSNGEIKNCNTKENSELFHHALGGYGLMGIILDVDLDVVENEMYIWKTHYMDYKDFAAITRKNVDGNPGIGLAYGRLSMSPATFLSETAIHTYEKTNTHMPGFSTETARLRVADRLHH